MGGGKTHLLVGFGLLANYPALRKTHCAGLAHADAFATADIAAFTGRNNPNHFFWGEIAKQFRQTRGLIELVSRLPRSVWDREEVQRLFDGLSQKTLRPDEASAARVLSELVLNQRIG
ncbi:MAG: hypothetical protein JZU52_12895 [Lamprocystis purpurea]|jgi:hypothetical protein|uniref:hypothetical protein n=1 Tax=Lamprocystis purpurea TaxID=61598 RepID=UPI00038006C9|nr:hypothetical protein [Lamprocystis purpurea]MBV5274491.1 hypothetical protein [Lamprocystis purpurea]